MVHVMDFFLWGDWASWPGPPKFCELIFILLIAFSIFVMLFCCDVLFEKKKTKPRYAWFPFFMSPLLSVVSDYNFACVSNFSKKANMFFKRNNHRFSSESWWIKTQKVFWKKKCVPRGWKQRKTFPNAKMDSDILYDLIKEQSLKHWFGLNVEIRPWALMFAWPQNFIDLSVHMDMCYDWFCMNF